MRWIAVAAGVLLVASLVGSEEQAAEEKEPPLLFTLEVNGEPHPIEVGKLLTLPAHEGPVKVLLKVAPYRVFRAPGLEFRFPRGWHLERDGKRESWNLTMRRFFLSVTMRRGKTGNVIPRDGRFTSRITRNDRPLRLAGDKVGGTTIHKDDTRGMVRTYYALRTGPDTVLLTFFELRRDGLPGEPSTEWKEMERWLQESLKVLPPTDK